MSRYQGCQGGILHLINVPSRYKKEVEKRARRALVDASKLFAYKPPAQVVIFSAGPEFAIPEVGLGAHATIQGDVVVNIKKVPYIAPIKNEMYYWHQAKRVLGKKNYNHAKWFFGHGKILPRWIGYRLGYLLVAGFMKKHKKISFAQLVRISSQEVLQDQQKQ